MKLHGSFPSHRPFIITEEDYRTYPVKFAPFVNMVQQSIMETIFCLIGFSGEDPNFLNWIGWVRDNLGESMPTIYLCGFHDNLSEGKKLLLAQKRIVTIDLSPLFPKSDWENDRHAKGLEWFLLNLMYGEPSDLSQWMIKDELTRPKSIEWKMKASDGLPKIPNQPNSNYPSQEISNSDLKIIENSCKKWREERDNYPGWLICPHKNRDNLWRKTKNHIADINKCFDEFDKIQSLLLIYELNWRLEKVLIPLEEQLLKPIKTVVNWFNPFPRYISIETAQITPNQEKYAQKNWSAIQEAWVHLVFLLMRDARESHEEGEFNKWKELLEKLVHLNSEWQEKLYI